MPTCVGGPARRRAGRPRAYRLPWPRGCTVFEVDQEEVLGFKQRAPGTGRPGRPCPGPRARRVTVAADLRLDSIRALLARGGLYPVPLHPPPRPRPTPRDAGRPGRQPLDFRHPSGTLTPGRNARGPGRRSGPALWTGGGYEIRTREGLPPTRFPSPRLGVRCGARMF
ncbi:class I SAM-dependent methyltransferase [Streptomyces sp. CB01580]|uniref:class I SAM-dependent methyltransferase n=1 Tax=Streptomyces sp. CB01580 TaxID=1703933 RepID=UPI003FD5C8F2